MNHRDIMNQTINVKMTRDQLSIIRAAYWSWIERQENITDELLQVQEMLNRYYESQD